MDDLIKISSPQSFKYPPQSTILKVFINFSNDSDKVKFNCPKIQRELDTTHIDFLYNQIKKDYEKSGTYEFGIFDFVCLDDVLYLVNGQHRYAVLLRLKNENENNLHIEFRIKEVSNEDELNNYFRIVNHSKKSIICKNSNLQIIVNGVKKHLINTYTNKYFPNTNKPHRPKINLELLIEKILELNIIEKLNLNSLEEFTHKIDEINKFYSSKRNDIDFWKEKKEANKWLDKACELNPRNTFYLGIFPDFEWLDRLLIKNQDNVSYENITHHWKNSISKKKPNKKLKKQVWDKRNTDPINGICFVCEDSLNFKNMQCGHIIAYYNGGLLELDNLEPICGNCNQTMGTTNLNEYKISHYDSI